MLTNDGDVLPLDREQTVALIGRHAVETIDMGGGSAQVNPPYQVSVAEGLAALLGDRVTVTDGVEVRTRPVPARGGFLTDPATGAAGRPGHALRRGRRRARGAARRQRHHDGRLGRRLRRHRSRAVRLPRPDHRPAGRSRSARIGVGDWTLRAGGRTLEYALRVSGTGIGEEILAPPRAHRRVSRSPTGDLLEAHRHAARRQRTGRRAAQPASACSA